MALVPGGRVGDPGTCTRRVAQGSQCVCIRLWSGRVQSMHSQLEQARKKWLWNWNSMLAGRPVLLKGAFLRQEKQ
jgi:hypothetical protein